MELNLRSTWWALTLRGVAAIIFGLIALIAPPSGVAALVLLFGIYALADGVLAVVAAVRAAKGGRPWGSLAIEGLVSLITGCLALLWPGITALAMVILIAWWSVITGIASIISAIRLRKEIEREWLLGLSGILSIALGVLLFLAPAAGLVVLSMWIGAYALVFGALMVALGLRLRAWFRLPEHQGPAELKHA
jgi:uncharacterized membrane protein HdeD (DUF308 family)